MFGPIWSALAPGPKPDLKETPESRCFKRGFLGFGGWRVLALLLFQRSVGKMSVCLMLFRQNFDTRNLLTLIACMRSMAIWSCIRPYQLGRLPYPQKALVIVVQGTLDGRAAAQPGPDTPCDRLTLNPW